MIGGRNKKYFDWCGGLFIPVEIDVHEDSVVLKAGNEKAVLKGMLYSINSDKALTSNYSIEKVKFNILSLELKAFDETLLKGISWLPGEWEDVDRKLVSSTGLQDNFLFLRKGCVSFFCSLDFPYSKINSGGIFYEPYDIISKDEIHSCHTLSIGACKLSGFMVGEYDRAEIEAASMYVEQRFPLRFEKPLYVTQCIFNRMSYTMGNGIFYSTYDNPTLLFDPDTLMEDIRINAEVGVEYVQYLENVLNWMDMDEYDISMKRLSQFAKEMKVRTGDYISVADFYGAFYNYDARYLDKPEWKIKNADGGLSEFCLGCGGYAGLMRERLVANALKYGFEFIDMDFLVIEPCYDTSHGHPEGDVYRQVRALVKILEALNETGPNYLAWSNSGNWIDFMPKLVWSNPNVYLTDPHAKEYIPTLNMLKFLGDTRREQMVSIHNTYFVPYRFFCNYEYYLSRRSRVHDIREFEYSLLQGLTVTPNLGLGELRVFLDCMPSKKRDYCKAFLKKWMDFIRENYDLWKHTYQIGDSPGIGSGEVYAHISKDHGYICLVNQNPFGRIVSFKLDASIGLGANVCYELYEIYPRECLIAEQPLPCARFGDEIACSIPPHGVRYIEARPYTGTGTEDVRLYGLPAKVEKLNNGYRVSASAPQGEKVKLGLVLPEGMAVDTVSAKQKPTVPYYTYPVAAEIINRTGNTAQLEVVFPREKAPRELARWRIMPENIEVELPAAGNCPFLGALVCGAFTEDYEVWLDIATKKSDSVGRLKSSAPIPEADIDTVILNGNRHVFETEFEIPFIEWSHFSIGYDDDAVIELAFTDSRCVKSVSASLNGVPVEVYRYRYPYRLDWCSYYIELACNVRPGKVNLAVHVEWEPFQAGSQKRSGNR